MEIPTPELTKMKKKYLVSAFDDLENRGKKKLDEIKTDVSEIKNEIKETLKVKYHFTNIPDEEDAVMINFTGTGIDTSKKDHRKFLKAICDVWGGQMYAMANDIPLKEIKFVEGKNGRLK